MERSEEVKKVVYIKESNGFDNVEIMGEVSEKLWMQNPMKCVQKWVDMRTEFKELSLKSMRERESVVEGEYS